MEIKPGILCLIIQGPACGVSATYLGPATHHEILTALRKAIPQARIPDEQGFEKQAWALLDRPVLWENRGRSLSCELPYEAVRNLLPIPPLNDELPAESRRELEHS